MVNEAINRSGAEALIPVEVTREIIKSATEQSAALALIPSRSMGSHTQRMPVLGSKANAYWVGGDTGLKKTTSIQWENKFLVAEELAVVLPIPDAVVDDADYAIWDEVMPEIAEAFAIKIDQAVLFGIDKPTSWDDLAIVPGAIAAGNAVARGSVADRDVVGDVNAVMAEVEDDGFDVNGFAARRRIRSVLRDLRDGNGRPIFSDSVHAEGQATIYGEPIQYVNNDSWDDSAADLVAGDWTKGMIGIRQDITFKTFDQGVISDEAGNVVLNLMQQDSKAIRAVMRLGFAVANPISRNNMDDESRYPFAVLTPDAEGN